MITELLLAAEGALTAGSIYEKLLGKNTADLETDIRKTQEQSRAIQKSMTAQAKEYKVMGQQEAKNAVSGFDAASPSFKAISQASFNAFLHDEDMIAMNAEMQENMLDIRKLQNHRKVNQSIFTSLASFGYQTLDRYPLSKNINHMFKKGSLNA